MLTKSIRVAIVYCAMIAVVLGMAISDAATIVVRPWESSIQDGIDAASDGDTVLIDKPIGPYQYTGTGNCDITFRGKAIVVKSIYGPELTIVDCEGSGTRAFVFNQNETSASKLIGLTIRNADIRNHNYNGFPDRDGGAIKLQSSPLIQDCIFENCIAWYGGAIYISLPASGDTTVTPTISNCIFIADSAVNVYTSDRTYSGGAICCAAGAQPTISDCRFTYNFAWAFGGNISRESRNNPLSFLFQQHR